MAARAGASILLAVIVFATAACGRTAPAAVPAAGPRVTSGPTRADAVGRAPPGTPQTASDFAQRTLDYLSQRRLVRSGTPVVLLSRIVTPLDLVCLGLGPVYTSDP